ncbi:MAG: hypothetical protein EHM40_18650 [Chloroflexi bacterium]|nr:MAG: hypothetical protein EHM40_18650 [Chloroflexota bacterium]
MIIYIKTVDGHDLHDSNYECLLLNPRGTPNAKPVWIEQTEADAVDAGIYTVDVQTKVLAIKIRNYANRHALISQLQCWFKRGKDVTLVGTCLEDSVDYQKQFRVVNLVQDTETPMRFNAILQTGTTAWRSVALQTDTWAVTGAGGTKEITVGGDDETRLIAELTATVAPASGYFYQQLYRFPNVTGVNWGWRSWCLTIDTAALVLASKMRADCFDLRLFNGDTEIKRWIDSPDDAATKVWFNAEMKAGFSLKLKTGISDSETVTALQFKTNATTQKTIKKMPKEGVIYHGTEWFSYSDTDSANARLTIRERGIWGTTKQAHVANDEFYYIQNPIRVVYGNTAATDPALDDENYDDDKPVFNLADSDNTKWVHDATTVFYDPDHPGRPGQWVLTEKKKGTVSDLYHVKGNATSGDPAMGIKAGAHQVGSLWKTDTVELAFVLPCPGGYYRVSTTGRKWRNTAKWMPKAGFQHSVDGVTWIDLWTEATPSALSTFDNWAAHSNVSIPSTSKYLRHVVTGIFLNTANAYALTEALTVTAEFATATLPTGTLLGEVANYPLALQLSDDLSGDIVQLNYPALYNIPFLMDGESFEAFFGNVNAHRAITLDDEGRGDGWLRLKPGTNTLMIAAVDVGMLSVALSWYRRRL